MVRRFAEVCVKCNHWKRYFILFPALKGGAIERAIEKKLKSERCSLRSICPAL